MNHPVEKVFPFFSNEKNLETLTPEFLQFKVIGKSTAEMGNNTKIDYQLKLKGVPFKWRSEIQDWIPNKQFVDTQLKGPYSYWHHTHSFESVRGGTLMIDRVLYRMPLGTAGEFATLWQVKRDLSTIFSFRRKKIEELFP